MKKIIIIMVLIIALAAGWYLASPLFIDKEVNEALPGTRQKLAQEMAQHPEKMQNMTDGQLNEIKDAVMAEAAKMPDLVMQDMMPSAGEEEPVDLFALKSGLFTGADAFHRGSGEAIVFQLASGEKILRLEDFFVTNGPDLRVMLSAHPKPANQAELKSGAYVELAKLKGNRGGQNYELPPDIDPNDYNSIVIYCKPFHVVFSSATLTSSP
jgi:hypothetical protein